MSRISNLLLVLMLAATAAAQTLYLRNPADGAAVNVTSLAVGTPPTLTATAHGFVTDDILWCDGASPPSSPLNGTVKVKAAPTADTFTLKDTSNVDLVVPSGTTINTTTFLNRMKCGKVTAYTVKGHPRGIFDGPGGTITTRIVDPDGAGASKAPNSSDATWDPLIAAKYLGDNNIFRRHANSNVSGYFGRMPGIALAWYGDQSLTTYRTALIDWFQQPAKIMSQTLGYGCPFYIEGCGRGSSPEYHSWQTNYLANVYTLIQGELSSGEKQMVVDAIFNGWNGESCTNQFQLKTGTIAFTSGSNVITGSGTAFTSELTVGQYISIPVKGSKSGWFPTVTAINSDTSMTISGNAWQTVTSTEWGAFATTWNDTMCGQLWFAASHPATPVRGFNIATKSVQMSESFSSTSDTEINVVSAADFSGISLPFYVYTAELTNPVTAKLVNPFEVIKVTNIVGNTLTVERGAFNSETGTGGLNKYLIYSEGKAFRAGSDSTLNLNWSDTWGAAYSGFVFASEDARARHAAEWGWNTFYDRYWPLMKDDAAAMTPGGLGNSYGGPRYERWMAMLVLAARNSLTPSLTLGDDEQWWKDRVAGWPYHMMPGSPTNSIAVNDSGPDIGIASRYASIIPLGFGLGLTGTDEQNWGYYWLRQQNGYYARAELAGDSGMDNLIFAYAFDQPTRTCPGAECVDYRSAAPLTRYEIDAIADTNSKTYGLVTSRTGWTSSDTLLWSTVIGGAQDHVGGYQPPGEYRIYRGGLLLGSGAWGPGSFGYPSETTQGGYVEIAGANSVTAGGGGTVDRKSSANAAWGAYWRTDTKAGYLSTLNVQSAYRHLFHLRGTNDYVVAYDNVTTTASNAKKVELHFMSPRYALMNISKSGQIFTNKHSSSMLNSQVVLPSDSGATTLAASPRCNNVYGTYGTSCQWNSQRGEISVTGTTGEFLVVHSPRTSTTDTMPTTSALSMSSNHKAVQIEDATTPWVAVVPTDNNLSNNVSVTTTFLGSSGRLVIAGVLEGTYKVQVGGMDAVTGISVSANDNTLYAGGLSAGVTAIVQTGGATGALTLNKLSIAASCILGGSNPANQTVNVSATGVTLDNYSAALVAAAPWFGFSPASGSGDGTVTMTFNCAGLTAGTYNATLRFSSTTTGIDADVDLPITLVVSDPASITLNVTPALTFQTTEGGANPAPQNIIFTSPGGTLDNWTASDDQAWCSVSPSSGTTAANIAVSVDNSTLTAAGSPATCTITISSTTNGVSNSPQETVATVNTEASANVTLSIGGAKSFTAEEGGANPSNQTLAVASSAAVDNWSRSVTYLQGSGWLTVTPASGTTVEDLTLAVDITGLVPGQYCANISVASTDVDVTNSPVTSQACVTITAAATTPTITEPPGPEYILTVGTAESIEFSVTTGTGTAPFAWTITGSLPAGMTASGEATDTLTISGTPTEIGDFPVIIHVVDDNADEYEITRTIRSIPPQGATAIELNAIPIPGGVIVKIRKSGLNAAQTGKLVLRKVTDDAAGLRVDSQAIPAGPAVKTLQFLGLPATDVDDSTISYFVEASYPSGTNASPGIISARSDTFNVLALGGTGTLKYPVFPITGTTYCRVRYGGTTAVSTAVIEACTAGTPHEFTITRDAGSVYVAHDYCSNSDCSSVIASSSPRLYKIN